MSTTPTTVPDFERTRNELEREEWFVIALLDQWNRAIRKDNLIDSPRTVISELPKLESPSKWRMKAKYKFKIEKLSQFMASLFKLLKVLLWQTIDVMKTVHDRQLSILRKLKELEEESVNSSE